MTKEQAEKVAAEISQMVVDFSHRKSYSTGPLVRALTTTPSTPAALDEAVAVDLLREVAEWFHSDHSLDYYFSDCIIPKIDAFLANQEKRK